MITTHKKTSKLPATIKVSDIQGRMKAAQALKPGEGENFQAATVNVFEKQALKTSSLTSARSVYRVNRY